MFVYFFKLLILKIIISSAERDNIKHAESYSILRVQILLKFDRTCRFLQTTRIITIFTGQCKPKKAPNFKSNKFIRKCFSNFNGSAKVADFWNVIAPNRTAFSQHWNHRVSVTNFSVTLVNIEACQ